VVLRQSFRSNTIPTAFIIIAIVMTIFILNAIQETSSRMAWSFARDNGLIFSSAFSQIHPKLQVPVYSLLLTYGLLVICGCVFLASTTGEEFSSSAMLRWLLLTAACASL
jgi:choline transport protein